MVEGVLQNACLRLNDEGDGLDRIIKAASRRRWFGRSSLAVGGAASLLLGAVFGGALEGIPVLFPPAAGADALPHLVPGSQGPAPAPSDVERQKAEALEQPAASAASSSVPSVQRQAEGGAQPEGLSVIAPSATGGDTAGAQGESTAGVTLFHPVRSIGSTSAPATTTTTTLPSLIGQAVNSVDRAASGLPVVGSTVSGALGSAQAAVGSLTPSGSQGGSSSASSAVSSTVQSTVQCASGLTVAALADCPVLSSLGGL